MLAHDPVRDAQAEPCAVSLGGDERVEHLGDEVGRDAGPVVLDLQANAIQARALQRDPEAALAGHHLRQRVLGVHDQVDQDLLELVTVRAHRG